MTEAEKLEMKQYNDELFRKYLNDEITVDELLTNTRIDPDELESIPIPGVDDLSSDDVFDDDVFDFDGLFDGLYYTDEEPKEEPVKTSPPVSGSKRIRIIKGNSIDLNKVFDIEKIEREHNGKTTYGIKFIFKGKNKYYRIVWFNENIKQRDKVYEQEKQIWQEKN